MKLKIYKQACLMLIAFLALSMPAIAQEAGATPPEPPALEEVQEVIVPDISAHTVEVPTIDLRELNIQLKKLDKSLSKNINKGLRKLDKQLSKSLNNLGPVINTVIDDINADVIANCPMPIEDLKDIDVTVGVNSGDLEEKEKTVSKSYPAGPNDVLDISNKYGSVTVNTWNKNEFKVDVKIKVATTNDGAAQKMLDNVVIYDTKEGSTVRFETQLGDERGSWSNFGKKSVRKIEINYTVFMPAKNALTVANKYGAITLPDLYGKVTIDNSYGNLAAKTLSNTGNSINVKYGGATIEGLSGCDLNVAYGNLNLAEGTNLNANVSYGGVNIGTLKLSGNINVKYCGGLNIGTLDRNLKNLSINSAYSGVKLGVENLSNMDFDVTVHYGGFNYDDNQVVIINKSPDDEKGFNPTKNYKGHLGKSGNSDKIIVIKSKYGGVKFE